MLGADAASIAMIDHLLDLGVDINAIQFQNHSDLAQKFRHDLGTPLHWAAMGGRKARVVHLLEKGADAHKLSTKGRTALDWAKTTRKSAVMEILSSLLLQGEVTPVVEGFRRR
jgi:ankyrin repeat protein